MKFKVGQKVVFNYNYVVKQYGLKQDSRKIIKKYSKKPMVVDSFNSDSIILTPNPFNNHKKYYSFPLNAAYKVFKPCGVQLNEELFQL